MKNKIEYDPFVLRQFEPKASGTRIPLEYKENLLNYINDKYHQYKLINSDNEFCKYLIIENNIDDIKTAVIKLSLDINQFIQTDYVSRNSLELPILSRVVKLPSWYEIPKAKYLCIILYSREQLKKEFYSKESNKDLDFYLDTDVEYGIVAIQSNNNPSPDPYVPITIMRNALGMEEGGNGVKLNRELYLKSVEFWKNNIIIG